MPKRVGNTAITECAKSCFERISLWNEALEIKKIRRKIRLHSDLSTFSCYKKYEIRQIGKNKKKDSDCWKSFYT